ncbi:MAG TPA: amino acid permease [Actinomycetes bacterium]|jgi:amino acid transporter|nr:amino acid permease [Actinomycetes bacterium]
MARPADVAGPGVFSRPASGLIRVAGTTDVFIYNVGLVSVGIAIALNQYYGPSLYQGAGVWLATLLAALGMLFVSVTFYCYANAFPRSGGVYVFLSRATNPAVAFVLSLVETVVLLYYAAFAASLIVTVGLSSFFATVGSVARNQTLLGWASAVATPRGIFWIGTLVLVVAGVLLATGTRRYFSVQRVLFGVAVLGTLVLVAVLLFGSKGHFRANLSTLAKLHYDGVIATARQNGFATGSFNFGESLKFLVWPLLPLLGAVQSVALGGEIKRVRRSQLIGMLGAVAATGLLIALFDGLAAKTFGYNFQGAIGFNSLNGVAGGSTEATVGAAPWFTVLAGILTGNVVLAVIIMATFVAWIWFWIPAELAYTTRTMIAWSFDRLAPDRLGYVGERVHTPVVAIGLSTAGSVVFMWLIAYRSIALLSLIEALLVAWGVAMAAAVVFPSRRREFYEASPVRWKVGGVPVMSIAGGVAALFFVYVGYLLWNDPVAAGPMFTLHNLSREFWIVLGIVAFGIAWFAGTKLYRRRQGIDIDLAFRQIPIE